MERKLSNLNKKMRKLLVWGALVTSISGAALPAWAAESAQQEKGDNPYAAQEARIHEVLTQVMEKHLNDRLDVKRLTDGAIRGLLEETGDPYSTYFTEKEFEDFRNDLEGTVTGIGIYIQQQDGKLIIQSIFEDSAAAKADLQEGDEVIAVDGRQTYGKSIEQVMEAMKGESNSSIMLTVKRDGKEFTVTLKRETMQFSPVDSLMLDNKIGYIALYTFSENSAEIFHKHLSKLESDGMKGLIIDLRDNGGGYVDAAMEIADIFVDNGPLVHVKNREGKQTDIRATPGAMKVPMAVLVNGGTASASEMLIGALQDYKVGTVIGTKTFGKGVVQATMPLEKGGILKLTVEEYFSPEMNKINGKGIMPNIVIEKPDDQLMRAITYLNGSTALRLNSDGTVSVAGFPAAEGIAKKIGTQWFIALRPFADLYKCQVDWDNAHQQAVFHCGGTTRKYSVKDNPYVRNENGTIWVALDKLNKDFPAIYVEKRDQNIFVHVK